MSQENVVQDLNEKQVYDKNTCKPKLRSDSSNVKEKSPYPKRVRELAKKAGFVFWSDEYHGPGKGYIDWSSNYDKELVAYTKLVIQSVLEEEKKKKKKKNKNKIK